MCQCLRFYTLSGGSFTASSSSSNTDASCRGECHDVFVVTVALVVAVVVVVVVVAAKMLNLAQPTLRQ